MPGYLQYNKGVDVDRLKFFGGKVVEKDKDFFYKAGTEKQDTDRGYHSTDSGTGGCHEYEYMVCQKAEPYEYAGSD